MYWPKICHVARKRIAIRVVWHGRKRSKGVGRRLCPTKKALKAPFEGLRGCVKTSPARASGKTTGRKKPARKKLLNSSHRRVNRTATTSVSGSLIAVSATAKTSVFFKASQKIGSAQIFW